MRTIKVPESSILNVCALRLTFQSLSWQGFMLLFKTQSLFNSLFESYSNPQPQYSENLYLNMKNIIVKSLVLLVQFTIKKFSSNQLKYLSKLLPQKMYFQDCSSSKLLPQKKNISKIDSSKNMFSKFLSQKLLSLILIIFNLFFMRVTGKNFYVFVFNVFAFF